MREFLQKLTIFMLVLTGFVAYSVAGHSSHTHSSAAAIETEAHEFRAIGSVVGCPVHPDMIDQNRASIHCGGSFMFDAPIAMVIPERASRKRRVDSRSTLISAVESPDTPPPRT